MRESCLQHAGAGSKARPTRRGARCAQRRRKRPCPTPMSHSWSARPLLLTVRACGRLLSRRWVGCLWQLRAMPPDRQVAALLGDAQWGGRAQAVDGVVCEYLAVQLARRQRVLPVAADGAACDPKDVACQVCHRCSGAATMLLCDCCDRCYHTRCFVPALPGVPAGDWVCPTCAAAGVQPPPRSVAPPRPQRRASYDDVACRLCAGRHGEALMLLCDGCDQGFHMRCAGVPGCRPPPGAWYCSGAASTTTAAGHAGRGARAHGARA
jgi:hypothetical protein